MKLSMKFLPKELVSYILLYLQCPLAKMIKNEIKIYENDHNYDITRIYGVWYVQSVMSFSYYYFDKLESPDDYDSNLMDQNDY